MKGYWRHLAALAGAVGVSGVAGWLIWHISFSKNAVDVAIVYTGDLTVVTIVITLLAAVGSWWWKGYQDSVRRLSTESQVGGAAERLAEVMAHRWQREAASRRIVTPAPVMVRWRWAAEDVTVPRAEAGMLPVPGTGPAPLPRPDAGKLLGSGVVTRLYDEVYGRLPYGRLVLVGGPGAGKTTAMILLLLAALDRRAAAPAADRVLLPVPVWLPLGGWNPHEASLEQWVTGTIKRDHPALLSAEYGPDAASALFRNGRIALFLDGLDEVPDGLRRQALKRLDEEAAGLRVVLTSRSGEYHQAILSGRPGNTAVIELRPVRPAAAAAFFLRGQFGPARRRWELLAGYLRSNPGSIAAQALDNPLALSLARDAYADRDPAELADASVFPSAEALRMHLIDQVLVTAYPSEEERARVTWWLSWIACHMGSDRDLPWWRIAAWVPRGRLRFARALVTGLGSGAMAALLTGLAIVTGVTPGKRPESLALAIHYIVLIGVGSGIFFGSLSSLVGALKFPGVAPRAVPPWRLRLIRGFAAFMSLFLPFTLTGITIFLYIVFTYANQGVVNSELAIINSNLVIPAAGAAAGILSGLVYGLAAFLAPASGGLHPASRWEFTWPRSLTSLVIASLAAGLGFGYSLRSASVGLALGLAAGLTGAVMSALIAWPIAQVLGELARAPDTSRPQWRRQLALGLSVGFTLWFGGWLIGVAEVVAVGNFGQLLTVSFSGAIIFFPLGLIGGLIRAFAAQVTPALDGLPRALAPRWPRRKELARVLVVAVFFPPMLPFVLMNTWSAQVADSPSATAASTYRSDRRSCAVSAITTGLGFGLAFGLADGFFSWAGGLVLGLIILAGTGLMVGLGSGQSPLLLLAELVLGRYRRGNIRFLTLLDDALARQVLRQAGTVYQFRHAALQDRLAATFFTLPKPKQHP